MYFLTTAPTGGTTTAGEVSGPAGDLRRRKARIREQLLCVRGGEVEGGDGGGVGW